MKILYFGDIISKKGINGLKKYLEKFCEKDDYDFIFANGENLAGGKGINKKTFLEIKSLGVSGVTTGNHIYDKKEIYSQIIEFPEIVRPLNYPVGAPGKGSYIFEKKGLKIALVSLCGRVFMKPLDCPFKKIEEELSKLKEKCNSVIIDIHAEATSEKKALGYFLDGRVSGVLGTHTHTQTNDSQLLPKGTFFISDLGMVGAKDSILGVKKEVIINHFLTGLPFAIEIAEEGLTLVNGVELIIDDLGKVVEYKTINIEL